MRLNPAAIAVIAFGGIVGAIFGATLIGLAAGIGFTLLCTAIGEIEL